MKVSLEYFTWSVDRAGYHWVDAKAFPFEGDVEPPPLARYLVRTDPSQGATRAQLLTDKPALFRQYAHLEPTEESYQSFSSQYGTLGVGAVLVTSSDGELRSGEPFSRWRAESERLQLLINVIDLLKTEDLSALREIFSFGPRAIRSHPAGGQSLQNPGPISFNTWNTTFEAHFRDSGLSRLASGWLQNQVNSTMANDFKSVAQLTFEDKTRRFAMHVVPESLLAAMWLQCARDLAENPTFRPCEHCGKWFEVSPDWKRTNSKYCDGRCRVAAFRARAKREGAHGEGQPSEPDRHVRLKSTRAKKTTTTVVRRKPRS